jgi:hypothetical protein
VSLFLLLLPNDAMRQYGAIDGYRNDAKKGAALIELRLQPQK